MQNRVRSKETPKFGKLGGILGGKYWPKQRFWPNNIAEVNIRLNYWPNTLPKKHFGRTLVQRHHSQLCGVGGRAKTFCGEVL